MPKAYRHCVNLSCSELNHVKRAACTKCNTPYPTKGKKGKAAKVKAKRTPRANAPTVEVAKPQSLRGPDKRTQVNYAMPDSYAPPGDWSRPQNVALNRPYKHADKWIEKFSSKIAPAPFVEVPNEVLYA